MVFFQGTIKLGPWGGPGGSAWDYDPGSGSSIIEIEIGHGDVVNSLAFKSIISATGKTVLSGKHGGTGGASRTISIDRSIEYLKLIHGSTRIYSGNNVIGSLTFVTNLNTYGPFGTESVDSRFEIPMENGEIVGFFGRAGASIDKLGIYVIPAKC
ncbi:hypothetical protein Q3G72_020299 [Acer saccharum]|nr:hypothetical protein Q3G72_020299 [Acer saccharum]